MASTQADPNRGREIVIAGGGFAALESLLALRALLGSEAQITLIAPSRRFPYRPAASVEALSSAPPRGYDLLAIAEEYGARFRRDRLEAVASKQHTVRLASFAMLRYDALVLALGARARVAIPGALTFRDQRDLPQMRRLLAELRAGRAKRLVFAVPRACSSPVPLYELALMTARDETLRRAGVTTTLVTYAKAPLEIFGAEASRSVGRMLVDAGVRLIAGASPISVRRDGCLVLRSGATIHADKVVAAPALQGPRLSGVPSSANGFVRVERDGRVAGLTDVYAAGEMTTFPVRHPGLAAQQADVIARAIAASDFSCEVQARQRQPRTRVPTARLLARSKPLHLHASLDATGRPLHAQDERGPQHAIQEAEGRYLAACLAGRRPLSAVSLPTLS